jgi:hypothetical protein
MSVHKRGEIWWYSFSFAGKRYQESTKSKSKTLAKDAEKKRRRELEEAFNGTGDRRKARVQSISALAAAYLEDYGVRHRAATFAEYALGHYCPRQPGIRRFGEGKSFILSTAPYQPRRRSPWSSRSCPKLIGS